MSSKSPVYTEHTRLPDPITAEDDFYPPDPTPVDEVDDSYSRRAEPTIAELPTESVQRSALPSEDEVLWEDVPYPELPVKHFFNRVTEYPVSKYRGDRQHLIQPGDVKAIIDRYREGETDPDTGRMRSLKSCCECQGFGMDAFLRRVQEEKEVGEYHAHAQRVRAEMLGDELVGDASDNTNDLLDFVDMHGQLQQRSNTAAVKRSELIVKTKAMVMGHLHREKYAPETLVKQNHLHLHGQLGANPLETPLAVADVDNLSVEDLLDRQRALRALPRTG